MVEGTVWDCSGLLLTCALTDPEGGGVEDEELEVESVEESELFWSESPELLCAVSLGVLTWVLPFEGVSLRLGVVPLGSVLPFDGV